MHYNSVQNKKELYKNQETLTIYFFSGTDYTDFHGSF